MKRRASEAVRAALRGHDPSEEQWAAIFHPAVPLAIIAGAGSGKTAVMAAPVVWLTEEPESTASQIPGRPFTNKAAGVVRAIPAAKLRARRIDFGGQVTRAVEIMQDPAVAAQLRARYPAILLDEYQDTNVAQRRLIQLLAPTGHNVTAVGDARQNIFQWRGSTLFNLLDFPTKHFLRAGNEPHEYLTLSENFRSGRRILEVANRVIDRVPAQRRPGGVLRAHPANGEGWVGVKLAADQEEEASFISGEIERLHAPAGRQGEGPDETSGG